MAHCPHLPPAAPRRDQNLSCVDCDANGPDLWICLHNDCSYVGCSENDNNHSFDHYKNNLSHCVQMAISGKHVWCFECKVKIVPYSFNTIVGSNMQDSSNYSIQAGCNVNNTSGGLKGAGEKLHTMTSLGLDRGPGLNVSGAGDSQESSDVDDEDALDCNYDGKPRGLVGLQNIGNTCYMNSAIQALSNIPPLTQYFLDCSAAIDFFTDSKKPGLSRSYQKLVKEMWNKRTRGYVVPNSILYGIRNVHPMFRGYHQHDTQEFLRCFMDQLHEELKEPTREEKPVQNNQVRSGYITRQPLQQNLSTKHNGKESGQNMNKSRISHKLTSTTGSKNKEINNERGRGLNRPQRSPARSYDNIPSATANRYYRVHTQSENVENGADFMHGHRRSASYCDPRGYIQLPQEFKGESPSSSPRPSSPLECMDQESSEREFDDDDEETYETCDSGVSDSASLSGEDACSPRNKGFKRKNESESTEKHANEDVVMESNTPGSSQFRSVISDVFDGRLLSSVQCLTCDRISTRVETFQDLSLPIPSRDHMAVLHSGGSSTTGPVSGVNGSPSSGGRGAACSDAVYSATLSQEGWVWWLLGWLRSWFYGPAVTLHDCLAAFFSADELKGDNMYSCEKCNKLRNGVKFSKVLGLPEVLCVHLKRFRHELSSSTKIGAKVSFPLTGLDMRPYLHKDCSSQVSTYELVAVICHAGTAGGGHYTCVARNRHANRWFEFDDQYVTSYSPEQVAGCEAYVLFYKKTNPRMAALRQKAMELLETSNELNDMKFYISKQWINRFNTYAEPGPIDNRDFLCPHGGVSPERDAVVERLTAVVSQPLWEFLYENFGGGPVCNHLHSCLVCCAEVEKLRKRQRTELEHFTILHKNFLEQESVPCIYAISMNWFRIWQAFARNKSQQPPPPIDNTGIIKTSQDNNSKSGSLPIIKPGSDYAQLNEELWNFFHDIYDGGPEVKLKSSNLLSSDYSGPSFTHTVTASNSSYGPSVYGNYSETSGYHTTPILYSRPSDANFGTSRKESDSDENYCVDGHYTKSLSNVDLFNVANKYDASSNTTCVKGTQSLQDVSVRNHISNAVNCLPQHNSHHPVIDKEENQTMLVETSVGVVDHPVRKISYSKDNQIKLKSWRDSSSDDSEYQVNKNVPKKRNLGRKSYRVSETIRPSNVDDSATDTFRQNSQREDYPADKSSISNKDDSTIISNHCQEYNSSCETGNFFNSNSSKSNSSPKSNKMKTTNSSQEISVSDMHTELPSIENIPIKPKTEPSPGVHQNANKSGGNKQRKLSYGKKMKRQQNASGHKKGNSNNVGSQGQGEFTPVVNGGEKIAK